MFSSVSYLIFLICIYKNHFKWKNIEIDFGIKLIEYFPTSIPPVICFYMKICYLINKKSILFIYQVFFSHWHVLPTAWHISPPQRHVFIYFHVSFSPFLSYQIIDVINFRWRINYLSIFNFFFQVMKGDATIFLVSHTNFLSSLTC